MRRVAATAALTIAALLGPIAGPAAADIVPTTSGPTLAGAIASSSFTVGGTTAFVTTPPSGTPNAVSDTALASFPTDGSTYAIMTSGDAQLADDANGSGSSGASDGGGNVRGNTDFDVSILRVDFSAPSNVNCLSFEFRFLSDEYPEYVGSGFNDAFVAELDSSTWTTSGSSVTASENFAFDPTGAVISINAAGETSMTAAQAAGTTYDGATPLLSASTQVSTGAHSLYLSIFDQGDSAYDSAAFVDNLELFSAAEGQCQEGAQLVAPSVSKMADQSSTPPGGQNGYTITVDNPNDEAIDLDSIGDTLPAGFTYLPGSTTGDVTGNPSIASQMLTWQAIEGPLVTVPADDSISLHFGVTVSGTPGQYFNAASASAQGFTIEPTGQTAPITVLAPLTIEKTADAATTQALQANGYTITVHNPNDEAIDLDSISDTLPAGFSYVAGSTTGDVTDNPSIEGQTLTWEGIEGLVTVPAEGTISLHFGVTVSGAPGDYLNEASADAFGFTDVSTSLTAPVTVTAPPITECDPVTLEGTAAGETLLGSPGVDHIRGLAGRDRIDAGAGDDQLCGGDGGDYGYGRDGIDSILGGAGNDRLFGGRDGDVIDGGIGHDALMGGRGADTFQAADGTKDCIVTGRGDDVVSADPGLDLVDPQGGCPAGFWL